MAAAGFPVGDGHSLDVVAAIADDAEQRGVLVGDAFQGGAGEVGAAVVAADAVVDGARGVVLDRDGGALDVGEAQQPFAAVRDH